MLAIIRKILGLSSPDYRQLLQNGAVIADVRTPGEFKAGHIPDSLNYPLDSIRSKIPELKKMNKPVITVCRSGTRSGMAKGILASAGIEVYNGGAWTSLKKKI